MSIDTGGDSELDTGLLKYLVVDRNVVNDPRDQNEWTQKRLVWVPSAEAGFVPAGIKVSFPLLSFIICVGKFAGERGFIPQILMLLCSLKLWMRSRWSLKVGKYSPCLVMTFRRQTLQDLTKLRTWQILPA